MSTTAPAAPRDLSGLILRGTALFSLILVFEMAPRGGQSDFSAILIASAAAVMVLALVQLVPALRQLESAAVLLVDAIWAAVFTAASDGQLSLITAAAATWMSVGLLSINFTTNAVRIVAVGVAVVVVSAWGGLAGLQAILVMMLGIGTVMLALAYLLERRIGNLKYQVEQITQARHDQLQEMRERARTIYEISYAMSSILKYEAVLDTALEAGKLGLRVSDRTGTLAAAVLLFHADDNLLHIATARGFTRSDLTTAIAGKAGIVGDALREAVPMYANSSAKDPELHVYSGIQSARSLLCIPLSAGFDNFGVLLYSSDKSEMFAQDHTEVLTAIGGQVTIALQNALLYRSLLQERDRIVDAEEEARKKLARDLHDGPTQLISSVVMRANVIQKLMERDPSKVPAELRKVEELARQTTQELRHLMFALRPLVLETQGLTSALDQLALKMRETFGQEVSVSVDRKAEEALDRHKQGVVFYIVEEAANNARKHAQAPLIRITIRCESDLIGLEIRDNGVGFDLDAMTAGYEMRSSLGMVNMRERANLLNGTLNVRSAPHQGTTITIVIPLNPYDAPRRDSQRIVRQKTTKLALAATARVRQGQS